MNELVKMENGIATVSSRDIAEHFKKNHQHILDTIRNLTVENPTVKNMMIKGIYTNERGKEYPEYLLTRDGFSLLVMGFTGKKALEWKLKYIEAFNKMETYIKQVDSKSNLLLQIYNGGQEGVLAAKLLTDIEVKEATTPLLAKIEEDKPLRDFAEHVTKSTDTIDIGGLARLAKDEHINIGRNRLFEYLRSKSILMKDNTPYQRYIDNKWFEVIEIVNQTPYGEKLFLKTLVTGKGQLGVIEMLRRDFSNAE